MNKIETLAKANNWSAYQSETAQEVVAKWAAQNRQIAAWSDPVAARWGTQWEFFIKASLVDLNNHPDEMFSLR